MGFHNRQYDPQIGRFLGVDPLAAGTFSLSPYTAMDNNPVSNVDPLGLQSSNYTMYGAGDGTVYNFMEEHMSRFSQGFRESMGWFERTTLAFHEAGSWAFRAAALDAWSKEVDKIQGNTTSTPQGGVVIGGGKILKTDGFPQGEGGDNSRSYKLAGDLNSVYNGSQDETEKDCAYYVLVWVENYLKSTKGKDGGPRAFGDFKGLYNKSGGLTEKELVNLMEDAGFQFEKTTSMKAIGDALNAGYPIIAVEGSGGNGRHAVVIVSIHIPDAQKPTENVQTKVYDPNTGKIERRSSDYWQKNGKQGVLLPKISQYPIKSP